MAASAKLADPITSGIAPRTSVKGGISEITPSRPTTSQTRHQTSTEKAMGTLYPRNVISPPSLLEVVP
jgi:hypothetical protein